MGTDALCFTLCLHDVRRLLLKSSWTSLAYSRDGTRLVAAASGRVYLSVDGGQTWRAPMLKRNDPVYAQAAAIASDGMRLVATTGGAAFVSVDGGSTWSTEEAACLACNFATVLTMSNDGRRLASTCWRNFCASSDGGLTWASEFGDSSRVWASVAGSADGTRLLVAEDNGYLYLKAGGAWTALTSLEKLNCRSVACSTDGLALFAVVAGNSWSPTPTTLFWSTDGGATWVNTTVASARTAEPERTQLAASSDGTRLAMIVSTEAAGQAHIYTSVDGGSSWTRQTGAGARPYRALAMTADGLRLAAGADNDIVYLSTDGGVTWQ